MGTDASPETQAAMEAAQAAQAQLYAQMYGAEAAQEAQAQMYAQQAAEGYDSNGENGRKRRRIRCLFFAQGTCNRGDACKFSHDLSDEGPPPKVKSSTTCAFWARGRCMRGN